MITLTVVLIVSWFLMASLWHWLDGSRDKEFLMFLTKYWALAALFCYSVALITISLR